MSKVEQAMDVNGSLQFQPSTKVESDSSGKTVCFLMDLNPSDEAAVADATHENRDLTLISTSFESLFEGADLRQVGCIVTPFDRDNRDPCVLLQHLHQLPSPLKVVLLAKHVEIPAVVAAIRKGASEILLWPKEAHRLVGAIERASDASTRVRPSVERCIAARQRLAQLTTSECEVVDLMLAGVPNKKIAARLDLAIRTVELRRNQIFAKLDTRSAAGIFVMIHEANRGAVDLDVESSHQIPVPNYLRRMESTSGIGAMSR